MTEDVYLLMLASKELVMRMSVKALDGYVDPGLVTSLIVKVNCPPEATALPVNVKRAVTSVPDLEHVTVSIPLPI
jgi:hypothetical protein